MIFFSGSCLFDWTKDIEVIENGPFELRIRTEIHNGVKGCSLLWSNLLKKSMKKLEDKNCIIS
jgi:hypothetical protein